MEHNKFSVIITGRYKKQIDLAILAERISEHSDITPSEAQTVIKSRQSYVLHQSMEHAKAYQTKRFLQESGAEIKLEPAKIYYNSQTTTQEKPKKNKWAFIKKINPFKRKEKKEQRVDINWEEKPRFNRSTVIHNNTFKLPIGLFIKAGVVLFCMWYFWLKAITTDISGDGFDDNGNPVLMVFTDKQCMQECSQLLGNIRVRKVPHEHYIINSGLKDDDKYKLWKKYGKDKFPLVIAGKNTLNDSTKTGLIEILGKTFGNQYLSSQEKQLYKKHFHQDGTPKIAIYCKSNNGICQQLNSKLTNANLNFSYIEVDRLDNKRAVTEMLELDKYPAIFKGYKKTTGTDVSGISLMFN